MSGLPTFVGNFNETSSIVLLAGQFPSHLISMLRHKEFLFSEIT